MSCWTVRPSSFYEDNSTLEYILHSEVFRNESVTKLSGAVQIPTVVYDEMLSPDEDSESWSEFPKFANFLEEQFPLVHKHLKVDSVPNSHGLLYTWEGTAPSLKPLLLLAHQDVVPVQEATEDEWLHPPFSGYFDGENIWGRGSLDDKSMLIATLQSVEKLLDEGFAPERGVVIALGCDEEAGGPHGAAKMSVVLQELYGPGSFHAMIDEGGGAVVEIGGTVFARPSVAEKGFLTLRISLTTPGGHSSVPPVHTNIGLISRLVARIEDNPFPPMMGDNNPIMNYMQCLAKHSAEFDPELKKNIFKAVYDKVAKSKVLEYLDGIRFYKYLVRTSQAIDIIKGGVKDNALPEFVSFDLNHRISVESSVDETVEKIIGDVKVICDEFDLGAYYGTREVVPSTDKGHFNISILSQLPPAKISPMDDNTWFIYSGTLKHIIEDYIYPGMTTPVVVAGSINTGNTDTVHYKPLTDHIYRFRLSTANAVSDSGVHSVNEHATIENHLYQVAFLYEYIKNVQEFAKAD